MDRWECYRILDVPPNATEDQIRHAWRELNKVWHPDRFGQDEALRRRAEEKLKEINRAYEILKSGRAGSGRPRSEDRDRSGPGPAEWAVRDERREIRAESFEQIARWVLAGKLEGSDEVFDPRQDVWIRVSDIPELARLLRIQTLQKWTRFALFAGLLGFFILIRRPVGLIAMVGLSLIGFAFVMMWLYRRSIR